MEYASFKQRLVIQFLFAQNCVFHDKANLIFGTNSPISPAPMVTIILALLSKIDGIKSPFVTHFLFGFSILESYQLDVMPSIGNSLAG